MKNSLDHLNQARRDQILAITEIIKDVAVPEIIMLFGSYADPEREPVEDEYITGDGTREEYISDYDFLVVTQNTLSKFSELESTIMERLDRFRHPVNLEIHDIDYINEGLKWGQYFFVDIVQKGVVLYNSGKVQFIEPRLLSPREEKEKAQRYFDFWSNRTAGFLKTAKFNLSEGDYRTGAFILHQAAESLFNVTLLVFGGYKPKTHNLSILRKKVRKYSEEIFQLFNSEKNSDERRLFDLLKRGYIDARYRDDFEISINELSEILGRVTIMAEKVEKACYEKIQSFDESIG